MNELKVGDWIQCHDMEDCKKHLKALSEAGYGAVVMSANYRHIIITSVPGK